MKISFFSLRLDLFSIIAKEVNQTRNNVVCVVARFVLLFCSALTTGRCNTFRKLKEIGVLRPIFPDYFISCTYVKYKEQLPLSIKIELLLYCAIILIPILIYCKLNLTKYNFLFLI